MSNQNNHVHFRVFPNFIQIYTSNWTSDRKSSLIKASAGKAAKKELEQAVTSKAMNFYIATYFDV